LARDFAVPVVASAHTDYERYARQYGLEWLMHAGWPYLRWFYSQASRVLCPSHQFERHLQHRGVKHTGIWSRGVDLQMFSASHRSEAVREALGIASDQPMVLYVGRLAAEKNLLLLMEAWRQIEPARGNARLVVVGTGPLEGRLQASASPGVILAGVRRGQELSGLYAAADLFAFPSSTETFGNVLLEAMASGVASLAVRAGGVLDFARHDVNSWLVDPDDAEALGQGMLTLLGDRDLRQRLASAGATTAGERDWVSIFDGLVSDYQRAMIPVGVDLAA
jgi:glycosyltransferase involved in cell wall biosynthesis